MTHTTGPEDRAAPTAAAPLPGTGDPATTIATALTAIWLLGALAFWVFLPTPEGGGSGWRWPVVLVALVLPVALIWVAAISARSARIIREESARLSAAVDAIRATQAQQVQGQPAGTRAPLEAKLEEIARAQRQTELTLARLAEGAAALPAGSAAVPASPALPGGTPSASGPAEGAGQAAATETQPQLALATPGEPQPTPISNEDFIRALHFPEDERDGAGFRALRIALKDHFSAGLVRSAQDVLTLLAEDGIYMDDLSPDLARPEVWRRFAQGERGRGIAALGGVRDRTCLALTAGRMRQDPVFRDVAHHFLRKFDHTFAAFEPRASDAEIVALSETRTARAFMLLGRVAGTFD